VLARLSFKQALMADLTLFYCDHHDIPLPPGHKFPLPKYRMTRELIERDGRFRLVRSPFAELANIERVHDPGYIRNFLEGTLDRSVLRRIGFPWSKELVSRTLASVGGTLAATHHAMASGLGGTLAGGTHHAFRNEGSGFCVFNDLAIAVEWVRAEYALSRIAIVDLDVHQGDGTAAIFDRDSGVFTLSLHGARNFPFRKQRSRLDFEFEDGTTEDEYLPVLDRALSSVREFAPELIFFQSGVDSLQSDRLGRLALSHEGLACRDKLVLSYAKSAGIPIVITLGGGYSEPLELTAMAHAQTFRIAAETFGA
jgi:acetoin utilization deacetylase AcuC-like enzyme